MKLTSTGDPSYDAWLFGDKSKLSPELKGLRERFEALNDEEKTDYLLQVDRIKRMSDEFDDIMRHPDKVEEHKKGSLTIKVFHKDGKRLVTGECSACKQFPCKHSGADFTEKGLKTMFSEKE